MSLRSALTARLWGLPERTDGVRVDRDVAVPTRDGNELLTDIWRPSRESPPAAVVIRTPYGRRGLSLVGELLAERGHLVVVQSCRGTFGSTGEFVPFSTEKQDGEDTLAWLRGRLSGAERILLAGASYMGHTAYAALSGGSVVDGAIMAVTTSDFREILRPHHVFGAEGALTWIEQLVYQEAPFTVRIRRLLTRQRLIGRALAVEPQVADRELLGAPYAPYQEWLSRDPADTWWDHFDTVADPAGLPPSVQIAGWFDPFLEPQLADYQRHHDHDRAPRLIIGPWTHGSPALLRTFLEETNRAATTGSVGTGARIHVGGTDTWHEVSHWPPATTARSFRITTDEIVEDGRADDLESAGFVLRFGVDDTVVAAGGRGLNPRFAGRRNQRRRERLRSVVTTSTSPLTEPLTIAGSATVHLHDDDDAVLHDHDWFIRLCDVDPAGRSFNVCDGFIRVLATTDRPPERVVIPLAPAAHTFRRGHSIRLQIGRTGQPWYERPSPETSEPRHVTFGEPGMLTLPVWNVPRTPTR